MQATSALESEKLGTYDHEALIKTKATLLELLLLFPSVELTVAELIGAVRPTTYLLTSYLRQGAQVTSYRHGRPPPIEGPPTIHTRVRVVVGSVSRWLALGGVNACALLELLPRWWVAQWRSGSAPPSSMPRRSNSTNALGSVSGWLLALCRPDSLTVVRSSARPLSLGKRLVWRSARASRAWSSPVA